MKKLKDLRGYETPQTAVLDMSLDSSVLQSSFGLETVGEEQIIG